ncbi:ABC transporter substrate-binding protein [Prauserella flavalba]|uniref:SpoVT-AbrB domain-containing protein n=1 Tax=Prauserella flavalba TaxID=1477506 RepID=A0A318LGX1_9PSEU|nr:ABC transporter substrate-binding protein [Prauserella flavalba]PXY18396.1 hypothetical protein BA062_35355 [Prauserella flavalba]
MTERQEAPQIAHVRSNGQVTLPVHVRRAAELREGDVVEVVLQPDGAILLRPVDVLDRVHADALYQAGPPDLPSLADVSPEQRASELVRRRQLPPRTGRRLEELLRRYLRGALSHKALVTEALVLGLPAASIANLLAEPGTPDQGRITAGPPRSRALPGTATASGDARVVRIAQAFHSLLYLPLYVAHDAGFFAEEGLTVEISTAGGGAEAWSTVESGHADYAVHDPVFVMRAVEQGVEDAVVVGSVCNGQAIVALAKDPRIEATDDPHTFITETVAGRTISTQPQPDSQWALLRFLKFLCESGGAADYRNLQVPIGTEPRAVFDGTADLCLAFSPQAESAISEGLHEVFDFSRFFGPYLLSALSSLRSTVHEDPAVHHAVLRALERACQYAHAFPEQALDIARHEFPDVDPGVVKAATYRCLRHNFLPEHVAVDAEAWKENGVINRFVGTIQQYREMAELVDNEAGLHAYRTLGNLRLTWDTPRPITRVVNPAGRPDKPPTIR